ncbi:MAG TPA: translocation/assembly module TamB domain-containing protein, partial [Xanthomonadales bacterium]|nr:translocation/assembly module TamB domain-containing protein [Xanthomonadales bacterium]
GPGVFEFQLSEGNLHSGKLEIPIINSGEIDMDFGVSRLLDGGNAALQASLKLSLRDLTPLQMLPYVDVVKGELNADIKIAGSLQKPKFTGHATLVRGHIEQQASGLVLSDIQLAGAVYQYDHTELHGSFRAGEGSGRIKADLRFEDFLHPEFSMQLSGTNLLLVDVPDMNLLAEPDLNLHWVPGKLQVNGKVRIPRAELSPRYLPASTAAESPDLVIVSAQPETVDPVVADSEPLKITGQVEVELGNQVQITLDRATARISGKSNFIWNDKLVPMGDGAFVVSGEIYAYGQLLNISEGRVSFPKVPADNPHLNIKAEREIFGNTQIKRAGVRVSGTLKRPNLDPYTDPMSNRERALALLLTGSDFDYEQGVGAVEVGMYIAPKLFVSYGIGLFEDQNVISARYDLGKGFGVKATSGQRETGVDISYTIDQ